MDIELATNEQLLEELTTRITFRGIVVWQKYYKGHHNDAWSYRWSNCDPVDLLEETLPQIREQESDQPEK